MSVHSQKVALVTGANRGLGLETSRQLAAEGVTVIMAGRTQSSINAAVAEVTAAGGKALPAVLDVRNNDQIAALRAQIEGDFGRLDILVNNAGIITGETFFENSTLTVKTQALRDTFEVNLFAQIALTQALLPLLRKAPAARVVNLSSVLGSITAHLDWDDGPFQALADFKPLAYDASKAALNMFTVHLAAALRDTPIKVNSAHPGWVKTDMGTDAAPMEIVDGGKTATQLALLDADGPTGAFIHLGEPLPW